MIRDGHAMRPVRQGWPRTSGDDPLMKGVFSSNQLLAPHERG